ncbi:hypothetical protein L7F22_012773 [Adiantum nelumboides]|nr:hypothetical protein [Adiantum nelumboides]
MHASPDVFSQRRLAKYPDPFCLASSARDVPTDIAYVRMQQSFKGSQEQHHPIRTFIYLGLKYTFFGGLLAAALLVGLVFCSEALFSGANAMGRQCLDMNHVIHQNKEKFAMVTATDGGGRIPGRSFDGLMGLVAPNKVKYAQRHGYTFINASDTLDNSRPPSWSKILAVRKHLPKFDWVFWNDVDSLVTNPEISLESIIGSVVGSRDNSRIPDLIITKDVTGVNAGMFFFHNTEWSMHFLELWWNQTSFVRPFGQMKSGDNDALKYLLSTMPREELQQHVAMPRMQCAFNSYLWRPTLKSGIRLMKLPQVVWQGAYSRGDFMVHLAGLNNKKAWVQTFLADLEEEQATSLRNSSRKEGPIWMDFM